MDKIERFFVCSPKVIQPTGEKGFEEFFIEHEILDLERFQHLGIIKNDLVLEIEKLNLFEQKIQQMLVHQNWDKEQIVALFHEMLPAFGHKETGKYLDSKM